MTWGVTAKAVRNTSAFFFFLNKLGCNRNRLKQQHIKHALSRAVSCPAVINLPNVSQTSKTCSPLGWQVSISLLRRASGDYSLLLAAGCSGALVICAAEILLLSLFELQHTGVWDGGPVGRAPVWPAVSHSCPSCTC